MITIDPAFLVPWITGHGLLLALVIVRRILRETAGF